MRQVIKIGLKIGPNTYDGKRGAPRSVVQILPPPVVGLGPVVVLEVDPTVVAPDCTFRVARVNEKVDETIVGERMGHSGDLFIFSPCFTQEFAARVKALNKE